MEFFPNPLDRAESDAMVQRISENFTRHGFGIWAVEAFGVAEFIGATGLSVPRYETPFTPCVEIAWRLAYEYWGFGYATEAARSALDYGFRTAGLQQIVAFTYEGNLRSRKVMERLGMRHSPEDDFDHPLVPSGHRLRRHVLYRLDSELYLSAGSQPGGEARIAISLASDGCRTSTGRDRVLAIRRSRSPETTLIKDQNTPLASRTPSRRAGTRALPVQGFSPALG